MIIGSKIIFHKRLESTNIFAAGLLKKVNLPEGTVIRTDFQTAGKGQLGNKWESEAGKNLLMSVVLYLGIIPENQFIISMVISLGIQDFLKKFVPDCKIKWPNDIYAGDRKIGGILIENSILENSLKTTIAGIGLNINQSEFLAGAPNAVSLKMITSDDYDLDDCLKQLSVNLDKRYKQLKSGNESEIRDEYIISLYRAWEWHSFRTENGNFSGRIISVTRSGLLQIEDEMTSIHEFSFKEIDFKL